MTDVANHPSGTRTSRWSSWRASSVSVGAPIQYYAAVDLAGFRTLVDAAGGVTITNGQAVDDPTYAWPDGRHGFKLAAGTHALEARMPSPTFAPDPPRGQRRGSLSASAGSAAGTPSEAHDSIDAAEDPAARRAGGRHAPDQLPSDQISQMLDLANGIDTSRSRRSSSAHRTRCACPGARPTDRLLHLDLDQVANMSIDLFGSESAYHRE